MLTYSQLNTLLTEVEAVVNSRPMVYVGGDLDYEHLCPASFLVLNPQPKQGITALKEDEDPDFTVNQSSTEKVINLWKKAQNQLNEFWNIWSRDYLLSLS